MSTGKPPAPQAISALLRKAGFEKSESSASRIKGWRNYSEGYLVRGYTYEVEVEHHTGLGRGEASRDRRLEMLERYAEVIRAAGWQASTANTRQVLIVTAKEGK